MSKGEEAKRKILNSAIKEFGTHGLHLATLDKIASKAKVPKPLIIYYFENKTNLLKASIEAAIKNFTEVNDARILDDLSGKEKVNSILENNLDLAKKYPDSTRLMITLYSSATWDRDLSELYETVVGSVRNRYTGFLKSAHREGHLARELDYDSTARSIHYWIIGAMIDFLNAERKRSAENRCRSDWRTFTLPLFR